MRVWGPAASWAAVLFLLSAVPGSDLGPMVPHLDKVAHLALYAVLGGTLGWVRMNRVPRLSHALLVALGLLYALSDEAHQAFVPGRTPDGIDLVADALGVVMGYGLFLRWRGRAQGDNPGESK